MLLEFKRHIGAKLRSPHPWVVLGLLGLSAAFQYSSFLGTPPEACLPFDLHSPGRVSFLIPIVYASLSLGPFAGLVASVLSWLLMIHPAVFLSARPVNALIEADGVTIVGVLWCLYLRSQQTQKELMEIDVQRLSQVQEELQGHIDLLEENGRRLAALHDISNLVTQGLEIRELLDRCMETIASATNVEMVLIFLVNQERKELGLVAARGVGPAFLAAVDRMKLGEGFNGRVAASGEPMLVEDASNDPRLSRVEVRNERLQAQLIVPLKFKGTITGTLCVAVRQARDFGPAEIALLTAIGNEVGVAIEYARARERQEQALARLRVSERNYRTLFEGANDAIIVRTVGGRIVAANRACADLTGYPVGELVGMNVFDILQGESPSTAAQQGEPLDREEDIDKAHEWALVRRDGSTAIVALSTSSTAIDGEIPALQHVVRDITAERRARENMRLYVQQVTRAQEEERKRIARELHDDTVQVLSALSREVDNFLRRNPSLAAAERNFLSDLRERLNQGVRDVRLFGHNLRPSVLDDLGLLPALNSLINELRNQHGVEAELKVMGPERRFAPEAEVLVFRIVQEAVTNIRRHAGASAAEVTMAFEPATTTITIKDNGRGFELLGGVHDLPRSGKLGLVGIQERVRLLGGKLQIRSVPDQGTTLTVEIPA